MPFELRKNGVYEADAASIALGEALNRWLTDFGPAPIFRTCQTCKFMQRGGPAFCNKYNATPPVETILAGCAAYVDQGDIPF